MAEIIAKHGDALLAALKAKTCLTVPVTFLGKKDFNAFVKAIDKEEYRRHRSGWWRRTSWHLDWPHCCVLEIVIWQPRTVRELHAHISDGDRERVVVD